MSCGAAARTRLAAPTNWKAPILAIALVLTLALGALVASLVKLTGNSSMLVAATPITTTITSLAPSVSTPGLPSSTAPGIGAGGVSVPTRPGAVNYQGLPRCSPRASHRVAPPPRPEELPFRATGPPPKKRCAEPAFCRAVASSAGRGAMAVTSVPSVMEVDVVVVGAGAGGPVRGGVRGAAGAEVALVSAAPLAQTASYWAQGGLAAALAAGRQPGAAPARHRAGWPGSDAPLGGRDTRARGTGAGGRSAGARGALRRRPLRSPGARARGGHSIRRIVHAGGSATGRRLARQLSALVAGAARRISVLEGARGRALVDRARARTLLRGGVRDRRRLAGHGRAHAHARRGVRGQHL